MIAKCMKCKKEKMIYTPNQELKVCKNCYNIIHKNPERDRIRNKKWRHNNLDYYRRYERNYHNKHKRRERNTDKDRELNKKYYQKNKEKRADYWKKRYKEERERFIMYNRLNYLERIRLISKKDNCENCGSKENLVKHHPDYLKPLSFITLCKSCHNKLHHIKNFTEVFELRHIAGVTNAEEKR